jgi:hypothetical protein
MRKRYWKSVCAGGALCSSETREVAEIDHPSLLEFAKSPSSRPPALADSSATVQSHSLDSTVPPQAVPSNPASLVDSNCPSPHRCCCRATKDVL